MKGAQLVQEPGAIAWNELNTRDLPAAVAFYTAILPVTAHDMSDGDFHYQTLQIDGADVAGMWEMSADVAPDVPPNWGVYFTVADTDASVTQATNLGASVVMPAKDSPYGRLAGLRDPQGAAFYVIEMAFENQ
jgi:predicted enzyme related to lactoylglutathione lyase